MQVSCTLFSSLMGLKLMLSAFVIGPSSTKNKLDCHLVNDSVHHSLIDLHIVPRSWQQWQFMQEIEGDSCNCKFAKRDIYFGSSQDGNKYSLLFMLLQIHFSFLAAPFSDALDHLIPESPLKSLPWLQMLDKCPFCKHDADLKLMLFLECWCHLDCLFHVYKHLLQFPHCSSIDQYSSVNAFISAEKNKPMIARLQPLHVKL